MTTDARGPDPADSLLETMAVGYVRLDPDWTMTHVNLAGERVLGRRAEELVGRNMWDEFPGARELEFGQVYGSVMETRVAQSMEAFYPGLDSWFELRVEPVAGGGIALYFLDVTARRRAADRLAVLARHREIAAGVAGALSAELDVTANVGTLARLVLPELGTWSVVSLVEDGALVDAGTWHVEPGRRDTVARFAVARLGAAPFAHTLAGRAAASHEVVVVDDVPRTVREQMPAGEASDLLTDLAPTASLQVPMVARGRTVGVLGIYGDSPYTAEQIALAREVAGHAASALDNSASYARARAARADAEAAGRRLTLLVQASEMLASGDDIEAAVGRLAHLVVPQLADWSIVTLVDAEGRVHDPGFAHRDAAAAPDVGAYAARRSGAMTPNSPLATVLRTGEPVVITDIDADFVARAVGDAEVAALTEVLTPHAAVVAPLTSHGRVFGALTLVTTPARGPHTPAEVQTALEVAARAGAVLDAAWSAARIRTLAESVQRSMLTVAPPGEGVQVATLYRPADVDRQVGGDWYDTFQRADGATVVTIGDVMGHDVAAISSMAQLRTIMRATAWSVDHSPAEVLATTDEISAHLGPGTYATVVTAHLHPSADGTVTMRWANAGHLPPAVLDPDGVVTLLRPDVVDPPLGVVPGTGRATYETVVTEGSTLLLYTDGLIERRGEDLEARLLELARVLRDLGAESLDTLLDKVVTDLAAVGQRDDVALLAVRVGGDRPAGEERH
ncbi:SpoIIE family protein phosphatase [Jatrophihabitans sp. YIM 134969]